MARRSMTASVMLWGLVPVVLFGLVRPALAEEETAPPAAASEEADPMLSPAVCQWVAKIVAQILASDSFGKKESFSHNEAKILSDLTVTVNIHLAGERRDRETDVLAERRRPSPDAPRRTFAQRPATAEEFRRMDLDGDGVLTLDEYLQGMADGDASEADIEP